MYKSDQSEGFLTPLSTHTHLSKNLLHWKMCSFVPLKDTHICHTQRHTHLSQWKTRLSFTFKITPICTTQRHAHRSHWNTRPSVTRKDTPICHTQRHAHLSHSKHTHLLHPRTHPSVTYQDTPICDILRHTYLSQSMTCPFVTFKDTVLYNVGSVSDFEVVCTTGSEWIREKSEYWLEKKNPEASSLALV